MPPAAQPTPPVLSDGVVSLRPPRADDAEDITAACQDPQAQLWTTIPVPYSLSDAEGWLATRIPLDAWWASPLWAVTLPPEDRWCGNFDLRLDGAGGAEVGFMVAPWARGQGHSTRALRLICTWAFSNLNIEVITWYAYVGNEASRRAARRVGFRVPDVVLRKHLPQRGERRDAWIGDLVPGDLATAARRAEAHYLGPALTPREIDVLGQLAHGNSNKMIAVELGISENTVKNHVRSILEKLQAKSRAEAVVVGLAQGLTSLPT
jgi:RimJ/RimL family protein N-acetyltransferase/DNA-binding CsgD family transcriptional regulator